MQKQLNIRFNVRYVIDSTTTRHDLLRSCVRINFMWDHSAAGTAQKLTQRRQRAAAWCTRYAANKQWVTML